MIHYLDVLMIVHCGSCVKFRKHRNCKVYVILSFFGSTIVNCFYFLPIWGNVKKDYLFDNILCIYLFWAFRHWAFSNFLPCIFLVVCVWGGESVRGQAHIHLFVKHWAQGLLNQYGRWLWATYYVKAILNI